MDDLSITMFRIHLSPKKNLARRSSFLRDLSTSRLTVMGEMGEPVMTPRP